MELPLWMKWLVEWLDERLSAACDGDALFSSKIISFHIISFHQKIYSFHVNRPKPTSPERILIDGRLQSIFQGFLKIFPKLNWFTGEANSCRNCLVLALQFVLNGPKNSLSLGCIRCVVFGGRQNKTILLFLQSRLVRKSMCDAWPSIRRSMCPQLRGGGKKV